MNRVNVYRFCVSDPESFKIALAPRAATAEAIARIDHATPLDLTQEEVEEVRLDSEGFLIV